MAISSSDGAIYKDYVHFLFDKPDNEHIQLVDHPQYTKHPNTPYWRAYLEKVRQWDATHGITHDVNTTD